MMLCKVKASLLIWTSLECFSFAYFHLQFTIMLSRCLFAFTWLLCKLQNWFLLVARGTRLQSFKRKSLIVFFFLQIIIVLSSRCHHHHHHHHDQHRNKKSRLRFIVCWRDITSRKLCNSLRLFKKKERRRRNVFFWHFPSVWFLKTREREKERDSKRKSESQSQNVKNLAKCKVDTWIAKEV